MKRVLLAILAGGICFAQTPPQVKVEAGLLQGTSENGLSVYRGIPFAAPPVGDLRWRSPRPAAKWQGLKPADKFSPRCYQGGRGAPGVETSEDCLYLNVWSPAKSARDRVPVLVWIYGGGFTPRYFRADLQRRASRQKRRGAGEHPYRVGQMGFFVHPELSAESKNHASGTMDRWI
jgi:para-nitrobenzyl esterase